MCAVKQVAVRLRPAKAAGARIEPHAPERQAWARNRSAPSAGSPIGRAGVRRQRARSSESPGSRMPGSERGFGSCGLFPSGGAKDQSGRASCARSMRRNRRRPSLRHSKLGPHTCFVVVWLCFMSLRFWFRRAMANSFVDLSVLQRGAWKVAFVGTGITSMSPIIGTAPRGGPMLRWRRRLPGASPAHTGSSGPKHYCKRVRSRP